MIALCGAGIARDVLGASCRRATWDRTGSRRMTGRDGPGGIAPPSGRKRVSFAGETGWELARPSRPGRGAGLGPAGRRRTGARRGLDPCGYRCLDGLRIEKGFRYLRDRPAPRTTRRMEAGLERFVAYRGPRLRREREAAGGCSAGPRGPERRLRTLLIGGRRRRLRAGSTAGEAVVAGSGVARSAVVRSCRVRVHRSGRTVGLRVRADATSDAHGRSSQVEVFGDRAVAGTCGRGRAGRRRRSGAQRDDARGRPVGRVEVWRGPRAARFSELSGGLTNTNYLVEVDGVRAIRRADPRRLDRAARRRPRGTSVATPRPPPRPRACRHASSRCSKTST